MSLSTLLCVRRRSTAASLGMLATPDSFRLNQSPLGAVLLPQAPITVGYIPSPEDLSLTRSVSVFHRLGRILTDHVFHPHGIPNYVVGLDVLLTIADVLPSGRCTRYAHNPCCFRRNRTPWPPSSSTRLPRQISGCSTFHREISNPGFCISSRDPELEWASLPLHPSGQAVKVAFKREQFRYVPGLHVTPVYFGKTVPPSRLPSCTGIP